MAARRRGWFRSSRNDEWTRQSRSTLAAAFLDMDRRQSVAEAAVHASDQMFPDRRMATRWEPVRARCYTASTAYMALNEELEAAERDKSTVVHGQVRTDTAVRQLIDAARGVDEFYHDNRAHLEHAVGVLDTVPQLVARAKGEAADVRAQAIASEFAGYRSLHKRVVAVDEAMITLDEAAAESAAAQRSAANRLLTTATELADALAQAPSRLGTATTAITSVRTRLAAVQTRAAGLAPAYSALLREFNAASSAGLADNERESERAIDAAAADVARSRTALADNKPEIALEMTTSARRHLTEAENYVDAVTRRLDLLRTVQADPQDRAKSVRFRLRDAQMLAVSKDLVAEWGSVLDAQAERIDRVTDALEVRHPDYWAYVEQLDTITDFIGGVVDRMRKQ